MIVKFLKFFLEWIKLPYIFLTGAKIIDWHQISSSCVDYPGNSRVKVIHTQLTHTGTDAMKRICNGSKINTEQELIVTIFRAALPPAACGSVWWRVFTTGRNFPVSCISQFALFLSAPTSRRQADASHHKCKDMYVSFLKSLVHFSLNFRYFIHQDLWYAHFSTIPPGNDENDGCDYIHRQYFLAARLSLLMQIVKAVCNWPTWPTPQPAPMRRFSDYKHCGDPA